MPAATQSPPLPPLSHRDTTLLAGLLQADCSLPALAERTNTPLGDLLDWAETPAVAARIATAERLANLHSALSAPSSRTRAIAALETLLADKSNPIETRRTATAILRALNQSLRPLLAPPRLYEPSAQAKGAATGAVNPDRKGGARHDGPTHPEPGAFSPANRNSIVSPALPPSVPHSEVHSSTPGPLIRSLPHDPIAALFHPPRRTHPLHLIIPDHPGPIAALRAAAGALAPRPP